MVAMNEIIEGLMSSTSVQSSHDQSNDNTIHDDNILGQDDFVEVDQSDNGLESQHGHLDLEEIETAENTQQSAGLRTQKRKRKRTANDCTECSTTIRKNMLSMICVRCQNKTCWKHIHQNDRNNLKRNDFKKLQNWTTSYTCSSCHQSELPHLDILEVDEEEKRQRLAKPWKNKTMFELRAAFAKATFDEECEKWKREINLMGHFYIEGIGKIVMDYHEPIPDEEAVTDRSH